MRASGRALHLGRPAVLRHPPAWHCHLASDRARSEAARAGPMLGLPSVSRIVPAATSDRTGPGRPWIPQFPARVIPPAGSAAGGPPPRSAADLPVRGTCRSREPAGRFQVTTLQDPTHPQLARSKGGGPTSTAPPRPPRSTPNPPPPLAAPQAMTLLCYRTPLARFRPDTKQVARHSG